MSPTAADLLRSAMIHDLVRRTFEAAGATATIGPHDLRHTSATHVAGAISEADMMALYGWRDADMARRYTAQARERLALEAHERASPLANLLRADNTKGRRPIS
ncbi:MAG: site-specific integrase [Dehalococcoidia bacterium]|nr:site-specific integrase [Dehalococcoidia bacterium]